MIYRRRIQGGYSIQCQKLSSNFNNSFDGLVNLDLEVRTQKIRFEVCDRQVSLKMTPTSQDITFWLYGQLPWFSIRLLFHFCLRLLIRPS